MTNKLVQEARPRRLRGQLVPPEHPLWSSGESAHSKKEKKSLRVDADVEDLFHHHAGAYVL